MYKLGAMRPGKITIAVTTRNRAESLRETLRSACGQDAAPGSFEVMVCDNGSNDHTAQVVAEFADAFPNVAAIFDARPGQLVGWHRCLAEATGDVVAFIDDDVRPAPGWVEAVIRLFSDPGVGVATGPVKTRFLDEPPDWVTGATRETGPGLNAPLTGMIDFGNEAKDIPSSFIWGVNFLARRDALLEARGFHPCAMPADLLEYYGDGEIAAARKIAALGFRAAYDPRAAVEHVIPAARFEEDSVRRYCLSQGFCASFNLMRRLAESHPNAPWRNLASSVGAMITTSEVVALARSFIGSPEDVPDGVLRAMADGVGEGLSRHHRKFSSDPHFRDWVLRPDYLDLNTAYKNPELSAWRPVDGDWRLVEEE